jgi:hypothetical protein
MVYCLFRALPGDRAFLPPSLSRIAPQKLDASVGASGPHGFAVRVGAARLEAPSRPPHPALHVRDDAYAPLVSARRRKQARFLIFRKKNILRGGTGRPESR